MSVAANFKDYDPWHPKNMSIVERRGYRFEGSGLMLNLQSAWATYVEISPQCNSCVLSMQECKLDIIKHFRM